MVRNLTSKDRILVCIIPYGKAWRLFFPHCFGFVVKLDNTYTYIDGCWTKLHEAVCSEADMEKYCAELDARHKAYFYMVPVEDRKKDFFPNILPCTGALRRLLGFPWYATFWHPFVYRVRKRGERMLIVNNRLSFAGDEE